MGSINSTEHDKQVSRWEEDILQFLKSIEINGERAPDKKDIINYLESNNSFVMDGTANVALDKLLRKGKLRLIVNNGRYDWAIQGAYGYSSINVYPLYKKSAKEVMDYLNDREDSGLPPPNLHCIKDYFEPRKVSSALFNLTWLISYNEIRFILAGGERLRSLAEESRE